MIGINEYFSKFNYEPLPEHGSLPTEVVWTNVGQLEIKGNRIYAGDSWSISADSVCFGVPSGKYEITAECFAYDTDPRVARVRGLLPGRQPNGTRLEGEFGVDVGSAGVMDADSLDRWADADENDYERWIQSFMDSQVKDSSAVAGFFPCSGAGVAMLHICSGFGDGCYEALSLLDDEEPVGFELVFLKPGQGYFEDDESGEEGDD